MISRQHRLSFAAAALIGLGCLLLANANHNQLLAPVPGVMLGCIFGTMIGQTTLAAAWAALGPSPLIWRVPLSLSWVALLVIAWEYDLTQLALGTEGAAGVMAFCLIGQWQLLVLCLGALAIFGGLRIRHRDDTVPLPLAPNGQFSMGQLLVTIAIVGFLLCVGRIAMPILAAGLPRIGLLPMYRFFTIAASLATLPLLLSLHLPRWSLPAALFSLLVMATVTLAGFPLMQRFGLVGPTHLDLTWINTVSALWMLAFALILRVSGYRLTMRNLLARKGRT